VESAGFEPASKRVAKMLSTCLVRVVFSSKGRYSADYSFAYLLKFCACNEVCSCYPIIYDASCRPPIGRAFGETSKTIDLVYVSEIALLRSDCISFAIYWLRELVFNGTISQLPTCLQIHIHAVKTKRPLYEFIYLIINDSLKYHLFDYRVQKYIKILRFSSEYIKIKTTAAFQVVVAVCLHTMPNTYTAMPTARKEIAANPPRAFYRENL